MKTIPIAELMSHIDNWLKEILKDNYVGVYFHGSLRLGSFNPEKSDLDFIIVVKNKLTSEIKQQIWDKMLNNLPLFPKKGFEFSVVLEENCKHIKYPTPYELHGSKDWTERYKKDKSTVINDDFKVDYDLASHFNVINVRNDLMDFGKPPETVFSEVPRKFVIDSNCRDIKDCIKNITKNPTYCILNLCRFYALLKDNLTLSKLDGGKWALKSMRVNHTDIIESAIKDYLGSEDSVYDKEKLEEFAKEATKFIDKELASPLFDKKVIA